MTTFKNYKFKEYINKTLEEIHFEKPTDVQSKVIPLALQGKDVIGKSPTGSGKSHAYILPILQAVDVNVNKVQAVILAPTRELAMQIYENLVMFKKNEPNLRLRLIVGGIDRQRMIDKVATVPHIVVATPGRVKDIGVDNAQFNLMSSKILVLDELDMIVENGFLEDVDALAGKMTKDLQMMAFSATISQDIRVFLRKYMNDPKVIDCSSNNVNPLLITHVAIPTRHHNRLEVLKNTIEGLNPFICLIFASKKTTCDEIYEYLRSNKVPCGLIHGDLEPNVRKQTIRRIKNQEFTYIVCSDMAARGIDIEGVTHVINFDLPREREFFFHRAGRTARNGNDGICYTFYDKEDLNEIYALMKAKVNFLHQECRNGQFIDLKPIVKPTHKKKNEELEKEIKSIQTRAKNSKVKPGYKKKVQKEIERVKAKHRREVIKKDIKKRIKERAIERTKKEKGEY